MIAIFKDGGGEGVTARVQQAVWYCASEQEHVEIHHRIFQHVLPVEQHTLGKGCHTPNKDIGHNPQGPLSSTASRTLTQKAACLHPRTCLEFVLRPRRVFVPHLAVTTVDNIFFNPPVKTPAGGSRIPRISASRVLCLYTPCRTDAQRCTTAAVPVQEGTPYETRIPTTRIYIYIYIYYINKKTTNGRRLAWLMMSTGTVKNCVTTELAAPAVMFRTISPVSGPKNAYSSLWGPSFCRTTWTSSSERRNKSGTPGKTQRERIPALPLRDMCTVVYNSRDSKAVAINKKQQHVGWGVITSSWKRKNCTE